MEMPRAELEAESSKYAPGIEGLESFKIVQLLRYDQREFAGVVRVKLRPPLKGVRDLVGIAGMAKVQELSKEDDGSYLIYGRGKPMREWMRVASYAGGHAFPPFELTSDSWRITFIGGEGAVRKFLKMLERSGLHHKVVAAAGAAFEAKSFLSVLTEKQREVLVSAHRLGFFDTPKRVGIRELGKSVNLKKSAAAEHLRRAQKKLLDEILAE